MILSRSNLLAVQGTSKDSPILNNLHVAWDGSTVAFDGRAIVAVSPVTLEMEDKVLLRDTGKPMSEHGVTVSSDSVKEVLKNLPQDKKYGGVREHVDLSPSGMFTLDDGIREKTVTAKLYNKQFVDYRGVLGKAKATPITARVVLNRARLANLLQMLDKICPDGSGESPVFMEFTEDNDIIMRCVNPLNEQRAVAYMTSYKGAEGQWLEEDTWEKSITTQQMPRSISSVASPSPQAKSTPGTSGSALVGKPIAVKAPGTMPSTTSSKPSIPPMNGPSSGVPSKRPVARKVQS